MTTQAPSGARTFATGPAAGEPDCPFPINGQTPLPERPSAPWDAERVRTVFEPLLAGRRNHLPAHASTNELCLDSGLTGPARVAVTAALQSPDICLIDSANSEPTIRVATAIAAAA